MELIKLHDIDADDCLGQDSDQEIFINFFASNTNNKLEIKRMRKIIISGLQKKYPNDTADRYDWLKEAFNKAVPDICKRFSLSEKEVIIK